MLFAEVYISLAVHWDEVDMGMRNLQTQYYLSYLLAWEGCLDSLGYLLGEYFKLSQVCILHIEEDADLAEFEVFAKKVAKAIKAAFPCKKVAQVVLGLEVPHAHIHLIPMNSEADVNFRKEHLKLSEEEFKEIANKIYTEFQKL